MDINEILEIPIATEKEDGTILLGQDFEKNALHLLYRNVSKKYLDAYTKSKLTSFDATYVKNLSVLNIEEIKNLLYICRFCSYFGKKYFPDLVVLTSNGFYMAQQTKENIGNELFVLICKLFGIEIKIYSDKEKNYSIDVSSLLNLCMNSQPYSIYWNALKNVSLDGMEKEKLEYDMKKLPFSILEKWIASKEIIVKDLEDHMKFLEDSNIKDKQNLESLEKKINHAYFDALEYTEKVKYLIDAFSMSEFKAIELVEFAETKD